jgi:hypothetical protein
MHLIQDQKRQRDNMKNKICILLIIFMMILSPISFAEGEDEVDSGFPSLQKILDTDEKLLLDNSSRYQFDGEDSFVGPNILELLGNLMFGFYKIFVILEIYLVMFSYKLELYKLMSGEIEMLMNPITTVIFETWKVPALLLLLLSALIKSFYSKVTLVINQIVIGLVVITISIIFLANPTQILDDGENVISSINSEILSASSISRSKGDSNSVSRTDDYLVELANQIWIVQVEKPWELLNFNNAINVKEYKSKFLEHEHGSKERDELTKELRKTVPERGVDWVIISLLIGILQSPKIGIMVLLSALNLGTDVMIVILIIVSGIIFLLALIPYFGIGVLINWFEKIISAFAISVLVTIAITLLNEITAVLYRQIDTWHILGILLLDFVTMVFLIVFRKWVFGGVKALRYGQRGVKSAMQNIPNTSEAMGHVKEAPYNFKAEAGRRYDQAKSIGSTAKKAATMPYRAFDKGLDIASIAAYKTLDRFGMAGRYKEDAEDEIEDDVQEEAKTKGDTKSEDKAKDNAKSNSNDGSSSSGSKSKKSESKKSNSTNNDKAKSDSKKSKTNENSKSSGNSRENNEEYVRYSDYNEKMKINKKYELEEVNEDTNTQEASKTFLNNQYKMSRRDAELEASQYVTLTGESKPVSYDESTIKVMEREAKGEPLFTPEEVKKSEIHIAEMSTTQNISKVEYINKEEKINLNKIMSDEKTYNAKDFKNGSESKESSNESKKNNNTEKMNDKGQSANNKDQKMNDDAKHDSDSKENPKSKSKRKYNKTKKGGKKKYSNMDSYSIDEEATNDEPQTNQTVVLNQDDLNNIKDEIIAAVEKSQDVKEADRNIANTKYSIADIIENDVEEKEEVIDINKKLVNIDKNVDELKKNEVVREDEKKRESINKRVSFDDYSSKAETIKSDVKIGDHTEK